VLDVHGQAYRVLDVVRGVAVDYTVVLLRGSIDGRLPLAELLLTANHLVQLENGTVLTAGDLVDTLGLPRRLESVKTMFVYHLETSEWVFLSVHGLGCESAARTEAHFAHRSEAHLLGREPDPSCPAASLLHQQVTDFAGTK
jgi:hypothetical protein